MIIYKDWQASQPLCFWVCVYVCMSAYVFQHPCEMYCAQQIYSSIDTSVVSIASTVATWVRCIVFNSLAPGEFE